MKRIFLLCIIIMMGTALKAQFNYDVLVLQSPYQAISGGSAINSGFATDDSMISLPIGFQFMMAGNTGAQMFVHFTERGFYWDIDGATATYHTGIFMMEPDVYNRADTPGDVIFTPDIRFKTTGSAGSRVFTAEIMNMHFYRENELYGTYNDSFRMQIQLNEADNSIELDFGQSNINHSGDYFANNTGPLLGYVVNYSPLVDTFDMLYYLSGNVAGPDIDSVPDFFNLPPALNGFPSSGTAYRLVPNAASVKGIAANTGINVLNTVCKDRLMISNNTAEVVNYRIVSLQGALAGQTGTVINGSNTIDVSMLSTGMYAIHLRSGNDNKVVRFVKL